MHLFSARSFWVDICRSSLFGSSAPRLKRGKRKKSRREKKAQNKLTNRQQPQQQLVLPRQLRHPRRHLRRQPRQQGPCDLRERQNAQETAPRRRTGGCRRTRRNAVAVGVSDSVPSERRAAARARGHSRWRRLRSADKPGVCPGVCPGAGP